MLRSHGFETGTSRTALVVGLVLLILVALSISFVVGRDEILALYAIVGVGIFIFAYLNTNFGLSVLLLSMLLSPEFSVGGAGGLGQMAQRNVVIRIDDVVLGLITVSWLTKIAINKELGLFIRTPLNRPIYFYLAASLVSTMIGVFNNDVRPLIGVLYLVKYFQYFLIFLMVSAQVQSLKDADRYIRLMLVTAALVSIYAIIQIPTGVRVSAPFEGESGEANTLGGYLVVMMSLVIGLMTGTNSIRKLAGYMMLLTLMAVPFAYTLSRSSWIAILPAILAILLYSPLRRYVIVGLLAVAIILPLIMPATVYERINYTFSQTNTLRSDVVELGDTALDPSTSARLISWVSTLKQWTEKPVFGWGVTGAGFKDAQYFRVLVETGILGFLAFMWLLWTLQRFAVKQLYDLNPSKYPRYHGIVVGFIAGFWGLLVHGVGANTFIIVRIMEPFWFLAAIVWLLPELIRREEAKKEAAVELDRDTLVALGIDPGLAK